MDVMQFAGLVSNIAETAERPSVIGPDADGVRLWLGNGWGVMLVMDAGGETARCMSVRFGEPFRPGWEVEPRWSPAIAPLASGVRAGQPKVWEEVTPGSVADILEQLEELCRVQPLPGPAA
jgi:hypothetical protein